MEITIVGAGLAGVLLAWRLRDCQAAVTLVDAPTRWPASASYASGGRVRLFDPDAGIREHAHRSLEQLERDPWTRRSARFRRVPCLYLRTGGSAMGAAWCERMRREDRSAQLATRHKIAEHVLELDGSATQQHGVWEPDAGQLSPRHLRDAVLRRLAFHHSVRYRPVPAVSVDDRSRVVLADDCVVGSDIVVVAAGTHTGSLLPNGTCPPMRSKRIQFVHYSGRLPRPLAFVDELTGLYGTTLADGGTLLGLPTDDWDPRVVSSDQRLAARTTSLAHRRLRHLGPGSVEALVAAADTYCSDHPIHRLRPTSVPGVITFIGGAGGAAKTLLSTSAQAADELAGRPTRKE